MNVAVDASGKDEFVCSLDDLIGIPKICGECGDATAPDADIAGEGVRCGRDHSTADDQVKGCHRLLLA
jgi:hypothetical protein